MSLVSLLIMLMCPCRDCHNVKIYYKKNLKSPQTLNGCVNDEKKKHEKDVLFLNYTNTF